jgi:hypothetical protein
VACGRQAHCARRRGGPPRGGATAAIAAVVGKTQARGSTCILRGGERVALRRRLTCRSLTPWSRAVPRPHRPRAGDPANAGVRAQWRTPHPGRHQAPRTHRGGAVEQCRAVRHPLGHSAHKTTSHAGKHFPHDRARSRDRLLPRATLLTTNKSPTSIKCYCIANSITARAGQDCTLACETAPRFPSRQRSYFAASGSVREIDSNAPVGAFGVTRTGRCGRGRHVDYPVGFSRRLRHHPR